MNYYLHRAKEANERITFLLQRKSQIRIRKGKLKACEKKEREMRGHVEIEEEVWGQDVVLLNRERI